MTAGPSVGPASAYPTLRRPASTCFSAANEVWVPGLTAPAPGLASPDCAKRLPLLANGATASVAAAAPRKRRRSGLVCSNIDLTPVRHLMRLDRIRYKSS